ncbi:MAG: hypothetical protein JWQ78_2263, partial [Sediminibacterium sp.]|nr:hypothetical protein [Sediminibacterium sp.]
EHELVMVVRWISDHKALDGVIKKLLEAMNRQ